MFQIPQLAEMGTAVSFFVCNVLRYSYAVLLQLSPSFPIMKIGEVNAMRDKHPNHMPGVDWTKPLDHGPPRRGS